MSTYGIPPLSRRTEAKSLQKFKCITLTPVYGELTTVHMFWVTKWTCTGTIARVSASTVSDNKVNVH